MTLHPVLLFCVKMQCRQLNIHILCSKRKEHTVQYIYSTVYICILTPNNNIASKLGLQAHTEMQDQDNHVSSFPYYYNYMFCLINYQVSAVGNTFSYFVGQRNICIPKSQLEFRNEFTEHRKKIQTLKTSFLFLHKNIQSYFSGSKPLEQ